MKTRGELVKQWNSNYWDAAKFETLLDIHDLLIEQNRMLGNIQSAVSGTRYCASETERHTRLLRKDFRKRVAKPTQEGK